MRLPWLWPIIIIVSTIAAGLVTLVVPLELVRSLVVVWFLFFCPGMTLMRFMHLHDVMAEWTLAVALSLALDAIVATALLYAGMWSPMTTLVILMSFTLSCAFVQIMAAYISRRRMQNV